jgi:hypothetical protein
MMNVSLKTGKWSIQYYDLFKLVGKHTINKNETIIIGYPEVCLLNIIIQLGNIKENTQCTMKNSNFAEILNAKERQIQVYLKHLKDLGIISTFEDRLKGTKHMTTKRTIYVKYDRIKELTTCEITQVVDEPHVELGTNDTCNLVPTTCEITHPYNDSNNDIYNDNISTCNSVREIIFSRTIDLKVLLRTVKETEHSIKSFIISNNIDSADDFIYFWKKLNEEDSAFMEKPVPKNKFTVLEKYNKYLDCNKEISEGYVLEDTDIFYTGNDNKQEEINGIFFSTNPFSCVLSLDQAKILKQLQSDGLVISKYFFRRNDRNK